MEISKKKKTSNDAMWLRQNRMRGSNLLVAVSVEASCHQVSSLKAISPGV